VNYRHRQRAVITDMAQFVTDDARDFITAKGVEEACRSANCRMLRISSGGDLVEIARVGDQRVGGLFVGDVVFVGHRLSIAPHTASGDALLLLRTKAMRLDGRLQF
jgi:hypothetical protein